MRLWTAAAGVAAAICGGINMGSEFLERNKRKSALALLLLFFCGRGKYAAFLLVAGLVSVPFVISGERLSSIMAFPAVASALRTVGLGGLVDDVSTGNAPDILAAAGTRETGGMKASFWERYLRAANAPLPPAGTTSTMAMLRGGGDVFGPLVVKEGAGARPAGPNEVKGAVNSEERAKGDSGDSVTLEGLPGQAPGGTGGDGIFGNLMGQNLGDSQGSGAGGTISKTSAMYSSVMDKAAEQVPVPGAPKNSNVKTGRVGGFVWKNMGSKTSKSTTRSKLGQPVDPKKPMYQLSETFAMTALAYDTRTPEYEASYSGATYDGNEVNADFLTGDVVVPPGTSHFAGGDLGGVDRLQQQAAACAAAVGKEGAEMGNTLGLMNGRTNDIDKDSPPWCCDSDVGDWNDTVRDLYNYCIAYTTTAAVLDNACQTTTDPVNCNAYIDMWIDPCGFLYCLFAWIICALIGFILGGIGLVAVVSTAFGLNLFGTDVSGFIDGVLTEITGDSGVEEIPPG